MLERSNTSEPQKGKQHNKLKNQPSFINSSLVNDEIPEKEWLMDETPKTRS